MLDEMPEDEEYMNLPVEIELDTPQRENEDLVIHLHHSSEGDDNSTVFEDRAQIGNNITTSSSSEKKIAISDHGKSTANTNGWWNIFSPKRGFGNNPNPNSTSGENIPILNGNQPRAAESWKDVS